MVVAGAAGFIGRRVVRALVSAGAHVVGLARHTTILDGGNGSGRPDDGGIELLRVDTGDPTAVTAALRVVRPAAMVIAIKSSRLALCTDPLAPVRDNVLAPCHLIAGAARAGCGSIVLLGSSTEYGAHPGPISEEAPLAPVTLHGATKASGSIACRGLARVLGVRLAVLRPFQVYGPGDPQHHLIPTAIAAALHDDEVVLAPHGRRDWIYVDDVAEAVALTLAADLDDVTINLGTGHQWTNSEVVTEVFALCGREPRIRETEAAARSWDREDWVADTRQARALLGWSPRHELRDGLRLTVASERARLPLGGGSLQAGPCAR